MEQDGLEAEVEIHIKQTQKMRPISSHLDQTSLINKDFFMGKKISGIFLVGQSGQDGVLLPSRV